MIRYRVSGLFLGMILYIPYVLIVSAMISGVILSGRNSIGHDAGELVAIYGTGVVLFASILTAGVFRDAWFTPANAKHKFRCAKAWLSWAFIGLHLWPFLMFVYYMTMRPFGSVFRDTDVSQFIHTVYLPPLFLAFSLYIYCRAAGIKDNE